MARITVAGGPSDARAQPGEAGYIGPGPSALPTARDELPGAGAAEPMQAPRAASEGGYAAAAGSAGPTPPQPDYASMSAGALRALAKERALPATGSKAELAARLAGGA